MQYGISFVFKNGAQHNVKYDTKKEKDDMLQAYVEDFLTADSVGTAVNGLVFRWVDILFIVDMELTDEEVERLKEDDKDALN